MGLSNGGYSKEVVIKSENWIFKPWLMVDEVN
jgi:hypothetical protein